MSRVLRSGMAVAALFLSLLLVPAVGAAPTPTPPPPPTLTNELLSAFRPLDPVTCSGGSGTIAYAVSGTATGPYAGTFTATGSGIVTDGRLTAFTATFTIDAPTGTVRGTQTLAAGTPLVCFQGVDFASIVEAFALRYQATIATPTGTYTDQGMSTVGPLLVEPSGTNLHATYTSAQPATIPAIPTSKGQCADGSYARFRDPRTGAPFANQGRCTQFVVTGK